jgi:hypothetical protein
VTGKRGAAVLAKFGCRLVICGAFWTATGQRAATFGAEFLSADAFGPALRTAHRLVLKPERSAPLATWKCPPIDSCRWQYSRVCFGGGAVVALGYVLGSNWRLVERWMRSLGAGTLILLGLTILTVLLWRWLAGRQNEITAAWQWRAQRYGIDLAPFVEFIRARLSPTGYLGLHFTVGLIALVALAWLFGGVTQDIFAQDPLVAVDQRVARFIAKHHTSALDSVAFAFAFLSNSWWMLFLVAVAAFGWALARDLTRSITAAAVLGGAYGLALGLQSVFSTFSPHVPQPEQVHGLTGFPSVTLTAATAAYGVACYSFAVQSRSWRLQTLSAVSALYIVFLIGLSAIYAEESLSAAIGGFTLGGFWLATCLTGGLTFDRLRSSNHPTSLGKRGC